MDGSIWFQLLVFSEALGQNFVSEVVHEGSVGRDEPEGETSQKLFKTDECGRSNAEECRRVGFTPLPASALSSVVSTRHSAYFYNLLLFVWYYFNNTQLNVFLFKAAPYEDFRK